MSYVDGFAMVVPVRNLGDYKSLARKCGIIWREHGALEYMECVGDDLDVKQVMPFPKLMKLKEGEAVVISYIVYKSRRHRDGVNKKVFADPRMKKIMQSGKACPFDMKRMACGGFKAIVEFRD